MACELGVDRLQACLLQKRGTGGFRRGGRNAGRRSCGEASEGNASAVAAELGEPCRPEWLAQPWPSLALIAHLASQELPRLCRASGPMSADSLKARRWRPRRKKLAIRPEGVGARMKGSGPSRRLPRRATWVRAFLRTSTAAVAGLGQIKRVESGPPGAAEFSR